MKKYVVVYKESKNSMWENFSVEAANEDAAIAALLQQRPGMIVCGAVDVEAEATRHAAGESSTDYTGALRRVLDVIDMGLCSEYVKRPLWVVLTALRGPDNCNGVLKDATTAIIRHAAFPRSSNWPHGETNTVGAYSHPDAPNYMGVRKTYPSRKMGHFMDHARSAFTGLGLVWDDEAFAPTDPNATQSLETHESKGGRHITLRGGHYKNSDEVPWYLWEAYNEGRFTMAVPPVRTMDWNQVSWINFILSSGCFYLRESDLVAKEPPTNPGEKHTENI